MPYENQRKVWHANFVELMIYYEDNNGVVLHTVSKAPVPAFDPLKPTFASVLTYCYLQGATLNVNLSSADRKPVTGRSHRRLLLGEYDDCTLDCEHFFYRKVDELNVNRIFNRRQRLRLVCQLINPEYGNGVAPLENDACQLTRAAGSKFGISVPENDVIAGQASFVAEEFL